MMLLRQQRGSKPLHRPRERDGGLPPRGYPFGNKPLIRRYSYDESRRQAGKADMTARGSERKL